MQGVTLTIALILSVLVIALRPKHAFVVYIVGLLWYPSYLAISIGTIDILVGRFVVAVLLMRCLFDDKIRTKFKWCRLDTLVTLSMVVYIGEAHLPRLVEAGAVGDICGIYYDREGRIIKSGLEDRMIAAGVDQLRAIDCLTAVACGVNKAVSVLGALRTGLISALFIWRYQEYLSRPAAS